MSNPKVLPPVPFAPKKAHPFCLVDGDAGLVLAASRAQLAERAALKVALPSESVPPPTQDVKPRLNRN